MPLQGLDAKIFAEHQCASGECISEDKLCDGREDCKDGSDEQSSCANIPCQSYLFRCAYGACINKDLKCDGKKDCKDNSDETNDDCAKGSTTNKCGDNYFTCKSGECIDDIDQCDGKTQCSDGSDETVEACASFNCPGYTYKCAYGACINKIKVCNGVKDCLDGSDESDCSGRTTEKPITQRPITQRPTPKVTQRPVVPPTKTPTAPVKDGCKLPQYPQNGKYTIFGDFGLVAGQNVSPGTVIQYACNTGFKMFPAEASVAICQKSEWNNAPTCIKTCPSYLATETMEVECSLNEYIVSCTDPLEGTIARLSCAPLYEDPSLARRPTRLCNDGSWDYAAPSCEPVCGLKSIDGTKLIINGTDAEKGEYPWQVAIYKKNEEEEEKEQFICGASIISPKITLSAAHCFETNNTNNYLLAAGKYYRKYHDPRDTPQYSNIAVLIIHPKYNGGKPYGAFDIAILVVETPFKMTKYVAPVCFDTSLNTDKSFLINKKGIVTGWGFTASDDHPSETLKMLEVDYKTAEQCDIGEAKILYDYAPDKLCAGVSGQGKSACQGDSGGGLVFPDSHNRYYIRGIVSLGPKKNGGCDSDQLTLYTSVMDHSRYIQNLKTKYGG